MAAPAEEVKNSLVRAADEIVSDNDIALILAMHVYMEAYNLMFSVCKGI